MNTFSWSDGVGINTFFKRANGISPHTGCVDHHSRAYIETFVIALHRDAIRLSRFGTQNAGDFALVDDDCSMICG